MKLLLSYTWTLLVTLLIFFSIAFFVTAAVTGDVKGFRDFYRIHFSLNPLPPAVDNLYLEMKFAAKKDPSELGNPDVMVDYGNRLRTEKASLLVLKNDQIQFKSYALEDVPVQALLPPYDERNGTLRNTVEQDKRFYAYAKFDFAYRDGTPGRLFVFRELSPFAELSRRLLPIWISLLFIMLVLTNVLLFSFVTRSVVKPLEKLRRSAEHIKEGQLDFQIGTAPRNEIGQLYTSFEEMRLKLKASVEMRLQYEENRKELLSNISHDLKTPLTTIKGYIEGIRDGVPNTPEKMAKYVDTIYSKTNDMDRLIDELFLYSKLDLNQVPFSFQMIDIKRYVRDFAEELRFDLENRGFQLELAIDESPQPWMVRADPEQFKRVLSNIIANSVKFADKSDRRIRLELKRTPSEAIVTLRDNGLGIPAEALTQIFDRFYRAEVSRNSRSGGSGLGLAIAKRIVEGHGGRIWAESEPGEGTSVMISLQMADSKEEVGKS
ncbi:sensor histidine kinase [Paenibacillus swuensis]|nr:HAMP domain-containing sensor histidine kinase [Paenibacillus swuensis]